MVGRRRHIVVLCVTTEALCRETESIELANSSDLVAGVTVNRRVGANEGETVLMLIDVVDGNLPAIRVVAEFALSSVLSAMKVSVAVLALIRGVRELEVGMAIAAPHSGVAPSQREAGLRVIEADLGGKDLPVLSSMTSLAGNIDLAVGAPRGCHGLIGRNCRNARQQRERDE